MVDLQRVPTGENMNIEVKYWYVVGRSSNNHPWIPRMLVTDGDEPRGGTLYIGAETTLFRNYPLAHAAIKRTERRRKDDGVGPFQYRIKRGSVKT